MTREEKINECKRLIQVYTDCRNHEMSLIHEKDTEKLALYERNLDKFGSRIINYKIILEALENGRDPESEFPLEDFT